MTKNKQAQVNEQYLNAVFSLMKKRDGIILSDKNARFSDTELRFISAVLWAKQRGERIISIQLAKRLGVTRAAISQIVQRLEAEGVVKRLPDEVDRKIAYIEITDETIESYKKDIQACSELIGGVIEKFGEEKFLQMKGLLEEFLEIMEEAKVDKTEKPSKGKKYK